MGKIFGFVDDTKLVGATENMLGVARLTKPSHKVVGEQHYEQKFEVLSKAKDLLYPETAECTTPKGHVIAPPKNVRDLGGFVSNSRSWGAHIERKMAVWTLRQHSAFRDRSAFCIIRAWCAQNRNTAAQFGIRLAHGSHFPPSF